MCGIVGYIGRDKALPKLIQGLKKLEYRGYDSAGVAYLENDDIKMVKSVGRVSNLENKLNLDILTKMGIGHTRWATHGKVTDINSHPHSQGDITIVHNGIIENYQELKKMLKDKGYSFKSDTDTEIAAGLIDYYYKEDRDILKAINKCMNIFMGSYAIVVMVQGIYDKLFVLKKDSPLVIMRGSDGYYIASDVLAYVKNTKEYFPLEDGMIGIISNSGATIYKDGLEVEIPYQVIDNYEYDSELGNFSHYMLKEIYEQKSLVQKWFDNYFVKGDIERIPNISSYRKIQIVGCGTAYHAGCVGKYLLEHYGNVEVSVFIASEYRYQKLFIDDKTLVMFISQSGETADTLACIKKVKEYGAKTLGIVNVENSSIARSVDEVIYTKALSEVAVASTKAYTAQLYVVSMLALRMGIDNGSLNLEEIKNTYKDLDVLIENALGTDYKLPVNLIYDKEHVFCLGRNIDYVTMMEGSLKLKEISYIHSEAYHAGELKHGTISLINDNSVVMVMATLEELVSKTVSNIKEIKARGAKVILFIRSDLASGIDSECYDEIVLIPKTSYLMQPIINTVYLQLIAYYVALELGRDIDKPRNLAKSVTVE